ncbi:hypothetical protein BDZ45DRAFT_351106 [Acephala macrosclerotiorum]|nr:hypothetical protein BDZ45DRAFT_351106 [Acephala macrosclerotiorum]
MFSVSLTRNKWMSIWAYPIYIMQVNITTAAGAPSTLTLSTAQSFATPTSDTTDTATDPPATGMSAGAKAGMTVGIVLTFLLMVLRIFIFFRWRGQHQRRLLDIRIRTKTGLGHVLEVV